VLTTDQQLSEMAGSPFYLAPEVLRGCYSTLVGGAQNA
jgi:hypothetical protein